MDVDGGEDKCHVYQPCEGYQVNLLPEMCGEREKDEKREQKEIRRQALKKKLRRASSNFAWQLGDVKEVVFALRKITTTD